MDNLSTIEAVCGRCGSLFAKRYKQRRYCSSKCSTAARREKVRQRYAPARETRRDNGFVGMSKSTVGAVSELRVSADLMVRGYHVFRALSPQCPCDLMAFKPPDTLLRIEVKTAYWVNGRLATPAASRNTFDVLACWTAEGVTYIPDLPADAEQAANKLMGEQGRASQ